MRPVSGGTQKLTMDSKERDYQQLRKQAIAQGDGNPSIFGIQMGEVANNPATQESNETGLVESGMPPTSAPQDNPKDMATDALEERLALYREAGNAAAGNNDRAQTMRMS